MQYLQYLKKTTKQKAFSLFEISIILLAISLIIIVIMKANNLIGAYRLSSARTLTATSNVNDIKGIIFWLDATKKDSLINVSNSKDVRDGDLITSWTSINPQKDKNLIFNRSNSTTSPSFVKNGIGHLPTIYFQCDSDGSNYDRLTLDFRAGIATKNFTIFSVIQAIQNTSTWGTVYMSRSTYKGFNLYKNDSSDEWSFWTGNGSAWNQTNDSNFSFNQPFLITARRDDTTSKIYTNTVLGATTTEPYVINNAGDSYNNFYIGASSIGFDGYISEIIMFNRALNDEERGEVESYLAEKYRIEI